jgi:hypothetical protein
MPFYPSAASQNGYTRHMSDPDVPPPIVPNPDIPTPIVPDPDVPVPPNPDNPPPPVPEPLPTERAP